MGPDRRSIPLQFGRWEGDLGLPKDREEAGGAWRSQFEIETRHKGGAVESLKAALYCQGYQLQTTEDQPDPNFLPLPIDEEWLAFFNPRLFFDVECLVPVCDRCPWIVHPLAQRRPTIDDINGSPIGLVLVVKVTP